jgi:hypothetical protein
MSDLDLFFNEIVECVDRMREAGRGETDSKGVEDAISELVEECRKLKGTLGDDKDEESGLLAWRALLVGAYERYVGSIQQEENAGSKITSSDYRQIEAINGEIETCRNIIREMLRILNPEAKEYQGRMPDRAEMRALLGRL